jgi:hypothetical protein
VCRYFLNITSAQLTLKSGYMVSKDGKSTGEALLMRTLLLITNSARRPLYGGSINFKDVPNPIADVLILSITDGYDVYVNKTLVLVKCI